MLPLRILVLVDTADHAAGLLAYARHVTAMLPVHFILCPLPPTLDAIAEPVVLQAPDGMAESPGTDTPAVRAPWPTQLPFTAALQQLVDEHRVTVLVLRHPYAPESVPRRPLITPALQLLTAPPCVVLLTTPGLAPVVPQHVLALGDGQPATVDWRGAVARTLLTAWQPVLHPAVSSRQPAVVTPARQPWRDIAAGLSVAPTVHAVPSAGRLPAAVTASRADLVLLVLRPHGSLARRATVLAALHSLVPVLLVPAAG